MSNLYDEDRLIVSEELSDRLSHLLEPSEKRSKVSVPVLLYADGKETILPLLGWDQRNDSVKVEVQQEMLETLARCKDLILLFFGEKRKVLTTSAQQEDKGWTASLYLDDI